MLQNLAMAFFFDPKQIPDGCLHAPATRRNREPILEVLRTILPENGNVLEIASGTGEHAVFFGAAFPNLRWMPTDIREEHLASIRAWTRATAVTNVAEPVFLDVEKDPWPVVQAAAVVNANLIHIAPFAVCEALMRGAARVLSTRAPLFLYGPFKRNGQHTADSNARFDERLRSEDPAWGVRDLGEVTAAAQSAGLELESILEMPANNLSLVFRRS